MTKAQSKVNNDSNKPINGSEEKDTYNNISLKLRKALFFLFFRSAGFFRRRKLSYDTVISYGGFIVSVAVLTASLSLLYGYQYALKSGILGVNGHIYFYNRYRRSIDTDDLIKINGFLKEQDEVRAYSPVLVTQGMAVSAGRINSEHTKQSSSKGVFIRSIDWGKENLPINYHGMIVKGTGDLRERNDAVLGEKLADYLGVTTGDTIRLISSANMRYTIYGLKSGEVNVRVAGIYRSGVYDTDSKTIFLNESAIRSLTGTDTVDAGYNHIEVAVKDRYSDNVDRLATQWLEDLEYSYQIDSWIDYNGNLFTMLVLQRWVIFIILSFIIIIASFGIVSNTAKTIMEKRNELGILAAIGADKLMIKAYIMGETIIMGILSVISGVIGGLILSWVLTKQTLLMLRGDIYFIDSFSIRINMGNLFLIIAVSMVIAIIASYAALNSLSRYTVIESISGK